MKTKIIIITILIIFCIASTPEKKVIVLAGQSNMGKSAEYIRLIMPDYKIINCAVYGTSITEWQKDGTPYNHCLKMVNNAQAEGYVVKGIFWYQGERDTVSSIISKQWKRLFYRFVYNFRQDIGVRAPVVFAQLGPRPIQVRPYWHVIKTQQRLSENSYKSLYMITTGDIVPYCPIDEVHFCPAGYIEIARRFVERFKGIEND